MMSHIWITLSLLLCHIHGYIHLIPMTRGSTQLDGAKFSQHAFRNDQKDEPKQPNRFGADSKIASMHKERLKTAGRVGTKRYVNPCKVFIGNLPFNATEAILQDWLCDQMGLPSHVLLNECTIIRDWKTGDSKGYGFAVFTEAVYGTVCIDKCNNRELLGRKLRVDQGKKKQSTEVLVKKKRKEAEDDDERVIQQGLAEAEDEDDPIMLDPEAVALFRKLDPDLLDGYEYQTISYTDDELFEDFFDEEYGDDEGFDGDFEEDDEEVEVFDEIKMNREQRRKLNRGNKKKKLPHKGFG